MVPKIFLIWLAIFAQVSLQWGPHPLDSSLPATSPSYGHYSEFSTPCEESETAAKSSSTSWGTPSTPGCPTLSITEYRTIYITTQIIETDTINRPPVTITTTESGACSTGTAVITYHDTVLVTKTLPGYTITTTSVSTLTTFACQAGTTYVTNYNYGTLILFEVFNIIHFPVQLLHH